jgi:heme a synthase
VFCQLYRTRPHPRRMLRLAWLLPIGVIGQALVGGVVVLTGLSPYTVMAHFLLSMVLLFAAIAVHEMVRRQNAHEAAGADAPEVAGSDLPIGDVRTPSASVRHLTTAVVVVAFLVLVAGTITTGAGPHGGDPSAPRLALDIRLAALAHADMVWLLLGLTVALVVVTWRGPRPLALAARVLLGFEVAQGIIGYTQYALGVPEVLVVLHVAGAVGVWTAASAAWIRARPDLGYLDEDALQAAADGAVDDEPPPDREAAAPR